MILRPGLACQSVEPRDPAPDAPPSPGQLRVAADEPEDRQLLGRQGHLIHHADRKPALRRVEDPDSSGAFAVADRSRPVSEVGEVRLAHRPRSRTGAGARSVTANEYGSATS
jgi:hypothetical protein